ncbi:MAG: hypothetical protein WA719_03240 [Thermoplasmata archaeon]
MFDPSVDPAVFVVRFIAATIGFVVGFAVQVVDTRWSPAQTEWGFLRIVSNATSVSTLPGVQPASFVTSVAVGAAGLPVVGYSTEALSLVCHEVNRLAQPRMSKLEETIMMEWTLEEAQRFGATVALLIERARRANRMLEGWATTGLRP